MQINTIINLSKKSTSTSTPDGKITILAINAAKVEKAKQLNHLNILESSDIFWDVATPNNLEKYVAKDVTIIAKKNVLIIFLSYKISGCASNKSPI